MNLYLLTRYSGRTAYDETLGLLIGAKSAKRARDIAQEKGNYGDEGSKAWRNPKTVRSRLLAKNAKVEEGVLLKDFNAG